jgi:hypothetical protein
MLYRLHQFLCTQDPTLKAEDISVICMRNTGIVYLIFDHNFEHPKYVVKLGNKENIDALFSNMSILHEGLKEHVAKPLHKGKIGNNLYLMIQEGLKGRPWIQVSQSVSNLSDGYELFTRSISVLNKFHDSTRKQSCWRKDISLSQELRSIYSDCLGLGIVDSETSEFVGLNIGILDELDPYESHPQHGDFCINNLLFDGDQIAIIDYDEFSMTWFPYFDDLMLAFSFHEQIFSKWNVPIHKLIAMTFTLGRYQNFSCNSDCRKGIILYFLLFRLRQSHVLHRDEVKADLIKILSLFIHDYRSFLPMN